jgi:hypothetical protein
MIPYVLHGVVIPRYVVGPVLALTGYRFDKTWRWAEHGPKRWCYDVCCTFLANISADEWVKKYTKARTA